MTVAVVICGKTQQEATNKMDDWLKSHPNEEFVDRFEPEKSAFSEKWCASIIVQSDKEWLPSDLDC